MDLTDSLPLPIAPTSRSTERPLISVVLPVYKPDQHLVTALRSVLLQDLGPAQMQIAVVDDASPTRDLQALLGQTVSAGRIEIYRSDENRGLSGNWNECLRIARGEIVHLLHQDDLVADGFYRRMLPAFASDSSIGMAFCRHAFIDCDDRITRISHRERWLAGPLSNWLKKIAVRQRIQCASALVRREVYEQIGGYRSDLSYALDWEMWVRIAAQYRVWYEPRVLAHYRRHDNNESTRLRNDDLINRDMLRAIELIVEQLPETQRQQLSDAAYAHFAQWALKRLESTHRAEDLDGIRQQFVPIITAVTRISSNTTAHYLWKRAVRLNGVE